MTDIISTLGGRASALTRIAVIVAGIALLWLSVAVTVPAVSGEGGDRSFGLDTAENGARRAAALLMRDQSPGALAEADKLATNALRREILNPVAVRTVALVAGARGDAKRSTALLEAAERMSRRDAPTQLALIEVAVSRGDIAGALTHYNKALLVKPELQEALFPVLVSAAAEPNIMTPLAKMLRSRPAWWRDFVDQMLALSTSPAMITATVNAVRLDPGVELERRYLQGAMDKLINLGRPGMAFTLYQHARGGSSDTLSRPVNGDFENGTLIPPFDWRLQADFDFEAFREPDEKGNMGLIVHVASGRGGAVADQTMLLPAGGYVLTGSLERISGDAGSRPTFAVTCAGATEVLKEGLLPLKFVVPAQCTVQKLEIKLASSNDGAEARYRIDNLKIQNPASVVGGPAS